MLNKKITMRAIILKQTKYWEVISGDEIDEDIVTLKSINEVDLNCLPADTYYREPKKRKLKKCNLQKPTWKANLPL